MVRAVDPPSPVVAGFRLSAVTPQEVQHSDQLPVVLRFQPPASHQELQVRSTELRHNAAA
jgi:hypothetical protein